MANLDSTVLLGIAITFLVIGLSVLSCGLFCAIRSRRMQRFLRLVEEGNAEVVDAACRYLGVSTRNLRYQDRVDVVAEKAEAQYQKYRRLSLVNLGLFILPAILFVCALFLRQSALTHDDRVADRQQRLVEIQEHQQQLLDLLLIESQRPVLLVASQFFPTSETTGYETLRQRAGQLQQRVEEYERMYPSQQGDPIVAACYAVLDLVRDRSFEALGRVDETISMPSDLSDQIRLFAYDQLRQWDRILELAQPQPEAGKAWSHMMHAKAELQTFQLDSANRELTTVILNQMSAANRFPIPWVSRLHSNRGVARFLMGEPGLAREDFDRSQKLTASLLDKPAGERVELEQLVYLSNLHELAYQQGLVAKNADLHEAIHRQIHQVRVAGDATLAVEAVCCLTSPVATPEELITLGSQRHQDFQRCLDKLSQSSSELAWVAPIALGRLAVEVARLNREEAELAASRSVELAQDLRTRSQTPASQPALAEVYLLRARLRMQLQQWANAMADLSRCRQILTEAEQPAQPFVSGAIARVETLLGEAMIMDGQVEAAGRYLDHAVEVYESLVGRDKLTAFQFDFARTLRLRAQQRGSGVSAADLGRAAELLRGASETKQRRPDGTRELATVLMLQAETAIERKQLSNAFPFLLDAISILEVADFAAARNSLCQAYTTRAELFRLQGQPSKALADIRKALEICDSLSGDASQIARTRASIMRRRAAVNRTLGDRPAAIEDLTQAIQAYQQCDDLLNVVECRLERTGLNLQAARFDEVLGNQVQGDLEQTEQLVEQLQSRDGHDLRLAQVLHLKARLYAHEDAPGLFDLERASQFARQAAEASHWSDASILANLANILAKTENYAEAARFQAMALQLSSESVRPMFEQRLRQYQAKAGASGQVTGDR